MSDWRRWAEDGREGPRPTGYLRHRTPQELQDLANSPDLTSSPTPAIDPIQLRALCVLMIERWGRYLGCNETPPILYDWLLAEGLTWEPEDKNYVRYGDTGVAWAIRTRDQLDTDEPLPLT